MATEYLTKWVEARALPEATAENVAEFLFKEIVCRIGPPKILLSDQGTHFTAKVIGELCRLCEIQQNLTTAYHPQTNGLTERFNKTLCEGLGKYSYERKKDWDVYITSMLFAYRTLKHSTTKQEPYYLLYGRKPTLPIELIFPHTTISTEQEISDRDYQGILLQRARTITETLEQARDEAKIKIRTAQDLQKKRHDQQIKVLLSPFREYDLVLRHKTQEQYSHSSKLETKWDGPFVIHKALPNSVYVLQTLEGKEIKQKVHGS